MASVPDWLLRRLRALPLATVAVDRGARCLAFRLADGPEILLEVHADARMSGPAALALVDDAVATGRGGGAPSRRRSSSRPIPLLAVDAFRPAVRAVLRGARMSWAERRSGYLHLVAPPYVLHLDGSDEPGIDRVDDAPARVTGAASRRRRPTTFRGQSGTCVETLLLRWWRQDATPTAAEITPTRLAMAAGVTVPLAHAVLHRLEQVGALLPNRVGRRTFGWRLIRPDLALDQWAADDRPTVRDTSLFMLARAPLEALRQLTRLDDAGIPWAVGGVRAADLYAPTLTAPPGLTVWVPNAIPVSSVAAALTAQVVDAGATLTVRQTAKDPWMRHRVRLQQGRLAPVPVAASARSPGDRDPDAHPDMAAHGPDHVAPLFARWRHEPVEGLTLVSPPRAYVEALADGRGRVAEVAEALRRRLGVDEPPVLAHATPA